MYTVDLFPLDNFPVECMVTDDKRRIVYINRYIEKQYGYSSDELLGADLFVLLSKASQIMYDIYIASCITAAGVTTRACYEHTG